MSASTERKNRQAARSEGTYRKDILAQEEAAKKKKQSIKWIIVGVALVIFFAIAIYINTGAMYRSLSALDVSSTEVTVGDITVPAVERSFSVAECNYVYNMQFVNFYNTYGSYASMFGLDVNSPLDEQSCPMAPEDQKDNYTWDDYFRDATKSLLTQMAAFEAYAKANDITLDKSDLESVDKTVSAIEDAAKENNYRNASKFLAAQYGKGTNESVARGILELEALANKVQLAITGAQSYTADQLTDGQIGILNLMVACKLASSNKEARTLVTQGGVLVNDEKVPAPTFMVTEAMLKEGVKIRKGKKVFHKAVLI